MPISNPEASQSPSQSPSQQAPKANVKKESREKEMQMVDSFIANFLQNLEASVTNIAVRIFTSEVKADEQVPTLLFRLTSLDLTNLAAAEAIIDQEYLNKD